MEEPELQVTGDIPVILIFYEYDMRLYWITRCNSISLKLFRQEIKRYNKWIKMLEEGDAPLCSYRDPKLADQLKLAKKGAYQYFFEGPGAGGLYEYGGYSFQVVNTTDPEDDDFVELVKDYENDELKLEKTSLLFQIIEKKHDNEEFSMGYRVLPITRELFK